MDDTLLSPIPFPVDETVIRALPHDTEGNILRSA